VSFRPVYLDASAILKLVRPEAESAALREALAGWPDRLSASIARVEVQRALRRERRPKADFVLAEQVLEGLTLIRLDDLVLARAAALKNPLLRALDAIHLAAALSIGDAPEAFITYDARLAAAATKERLTVWQPKNK
jgi:hypothetical protein